MVSELSALLCSLLSFYGRVGLSLPESIGQALMTLSKKAIYHSSLASNLSLKDPSWLILSSKEAQEYMAGALAQMPVGTSSAV